MTAPDERVLRLVGDDAVEAHVIGQPQGFCDLLGRPFRDADVVDLPLPHEVVERAQRLLEWCLVVEPVGLEKIDVICLQALERSVESLHDVFAREPAVVRVETRRPVDLREDLDRVALHAS